MNTISVQVGALHYNEDKGNMRLHPVDSLLFLMMKLTKAIDSRQTSLDFFSPDDIKKILIVSSTALGDTLLSTPAIRAVKKQYPHAKVIAHLNIKNMALFENNPYIDGIIPYHGGYKYFLKTIMEFRRNRFDLVLIFHGNEPQATPMAYLSGARFIVKVPNNENFSFLLSNQKPILPADPMRHAIDSRLKVAEFVGCQTTDKIMDLLIEPAAKAEANNFLEENGVSFDDTLVGFQPGASTVSRMWFEDRYIELGKKVLALRSDIKIVITGGPSERKLCESIGANIGERVIFAAGKLTLKAIPALINRLDVFVTPDTGPMHIAITQRTPVIALFAVAEPDGTGPLYDKDLHSVIKKPKVCDPCISKRCKYQKCMEAINVDEVFQIIQDKLLHLKYLRASRQ